MNAPPPTLSSRYFTVRNNFIALNCTDADPSVRPSATQDRTVHADGTVDYVRQCANDDPVTIEWRKKIGNFLAREVIRLPDAKGNKKYVLSELPHNYALFLHRKGDKFNPRTDAYLWGCRRGFVFRSPAEFFLHAKWLLLGCPQASNLPNPEEELFGPTPSDELTDRCGCKYCAGTEQGYISMRYSNYHISKKKGEMRRS